MLCESTTYFDNIIIRLSPSRPSMGEEVESEVSLPNENPVIVGEYISFLYNRPLPELPYQIAKVLDLYYFAERLSIPSLVNAIMDHIIEYQMQDGVTFRLVAIEQICKNTRPGSRIRWYIAACIAFTMRNRVGNLQWTQEHAAVFDYCPELFRDIFVVIAYHGMAAWDPQAGRAAAFKSTFNLCDFHIHDEIEGRCKKNRGWGSEEEQTEVEEQQIKIEEE